MFKGSIVKVVIIVAIAVSAIQVVNSTGNKFLVEADRQMACGKMLFR